MNLYERTTNVAQEILDAGLLPTCVLMQTNPHRGGSLNLMDTSLREALEDVRAHDSRRHTSLGLGTSRLMKTVGLADQLRQIVDFGVFKDFRDPPYRLDETPEWRVKVRLIETRVTSVLQYADALAAPDPRAPLEKIRDHVQEAERLWRELPSQEQDELTERQNVNEETSLRHCLRWGADHAEQLVDLTQGPRPA